MERKKSYNELIFQVVLHLIVFAFFAYERDETSIHNYKYVFFINYVIAAAVINYVGLPLFYKNRNIWQFMGIALVSIGVAVGVEEIFLEPIFFPGPRADSFKFLLGFAQVVPVVAILSGAKFGWDALHKQKEVDELKDSFKQSELQYLKSQINPHFLFNNLNNLYAYALEGSEKTPEIILELSGLLRYMLYECQGEYVSLRKEIEHLENFVNLNELQIEDRGEVNFNYRGIIDDIDIAPLILIVFVENAFKHSSGSLSDNIKIDVDVRLNSDGKLYFTCINNYQELSDNNRLNRGIGLENAKKRLELIYPYAYELNIIDKDNRYNVQLIIDLNN